MKIFALLLLLSQALFSTQTTKSSDEYDVTKVLNDTIVGIFQTVEPQNIANLISNIVNYDDVDANTTPYKYNYTFVLRGRKSTVNYYHLRVTRALSDNPRVSFGFSDNEIKICSGKFVAQLSGHANRLSPFNQNISFESIMRFTPCTFSAIRQSNNSGSFLIDYQYDFADIEIIESEIMKWKNLKNHTIYLLPSILRTHMNRNEKLLHALGEIFDNQSNKHISNHPHFTGLEHLYHYLIPDIQIASFILKDIVVKGLWNFHSLNFTVGCNNIVTYRLIMKDIRGSMILKDGISKAATLKLHYVVESLSIFVTQKLNYIRVTAENYTFMEMKSYTSLTEVQSDIIMDRIERTIGYSLMPSMEYQKTARSSTALSMLDTETYLEKILMRTSRHSDNKPATKRPYGNSTPFENSTNSTLIHDISNLTTQIQIKEEKTTNIYNYHISFRDTTINLLSGNPEYPDRIQCPLTTNSKFTHRINVAPCGKIGSKNNEANTIDVNFHFNYPFVNLSSIKSNISEGNGRNLCEFQIRNNRDIEVELPPSTPNSTKSNEQIQIKKKIDETLMSMTKDRIIRTVKPMICLPFDVCKQTMKMVDDFFLKFVDIVMKKCSLRRINK